MNLKNVFEKPQKYALQILVWYLLHSVYFWNKSIYILNNNPVEINNERSIKTPSRLKECNNKGWNIMRKKISIEN